MTGPPGSDREPAVIADSSLNDGDQTIDPIVMAGKN